MADDEKLKKKIQNALNLSGFKVRREYCEFILNSLKPTKYDLSNSGVFDKVINSICNSLENQCLLEKGIEKENIEKALKVCLNQESDDSESIFNVINAFDFPKVAFNHERKQYYIVQEKSRLLSGPISKAKLFLERYSTVLQRTKRNFLQKGEDLKLQTIDFLLTTSNVTLDRTLILGALFEKSEGKWYLEDPTGILKLNLLHAKFHTGFFNENSLVLVNGYYEDRVLHVSSIVLPPGEDYQSTRPSFGNINYFGGPSNVPLRDSERLKVQMHKTRSRCILFFSDLYLDYPQVFSKLECIFTGFKDIPPIAFVFMGNFLSNAHDSEVLNVLRKLFKKLAELIVKFQNISNNSQFVFVPGMADPCTPIIVPRFGLPSYVTNDFKKLVPKAIFTTNPCRIQYCTREIVVFRADLTAKFLSETLHQPSREEIAESFQRTIISQGHLSPLPLNVINVHWDFDHCLRLYPLPDLVVIGDKSKGHMGNLKDCHIVNPGPFCESGFQFLSYSPFSNTLDECSL